MIKAKRLEKGNTIGVVSPASPSENHSEIIRAKEYLENLGYKVVIGRNVNKTKGFTAASEQERADDINEMFAREDIDAILVTQGGYGSAQIIDKLDYELIRRKPKIFTGFSDITSLHLAMQKFSGLVTFYGPGMARFNEEELSEYSLTLVFDATALVDGDYEFLDVGRLPDSEPHHMEKVHFHAYTAAEMNVSRQAMRKSWKLPGFCALTEDILRCYPGKMFLTTYKDLAAEIPKLLAPEAVSRLLLDGETCPYFGGTNGSNDFSEASLVMLLGYPRLSPQTYLERAFVYWGPSGIREQVQEQMAQWSPLNVQQKPDLHAQLPLTMAYEVFHLAARLEQEIYRCQLRNAKCEDTIHVFLFAPPQALRVQLSKRFKGSMRRDETGVPDCIAQAKANTKTYAGRLTSYARFTAWLDGWDGSPTPLDGILRDTGIGAESWKKLRQSDEFAPLLAQHGAEMTGRGRNVKIELKMRKCA